MRGIFIMCQATQEQQLNILTIGADKLGYPEPYRSWINQRSEYITSKCMELYPNVPIAVLPRNMSRKAFLEEFEVNPEEYFIVGGVVPNNFRAESKINFHQSFGPVAEGLGYNAEYVEEIDQYTLPGYCVFDRDSLDHCLSEMFETYGGCMLKDPNASDMAGQYKITIEGGMPSEEVIQGYFERGGLVVEPLLEDPKTTVVGIITIDNEKYIYVGDQVSVYHEGKDKYGGGDYILYREDSLFDHFDQLDPDNRSAIEKVIQVDRKLSKFGVVTHARIYDVLKGMDSNGYIQEGVSDISLRTGGSTAGALDAILALRELELESIRFTVTLQYDGIKGEEYVQMPNPFYKNNVVVDSGGLVIVNEIF